MVAFSIARNFKALVGPSPPALAFLNGMRAISASSLILSFLLFINNVVSFWPFFFLTGIDHMGYFGPLFGLHELCWCD